MFESHLCCPIFHLLQLTTKFLKEFQEPKKTKDIATQTDSINKASGSKAAVSIASQTEPDSENVKASVTKESTSQTSVGNQTSLSEKVQQDALNPRTLPLVTPPLFGIDPKTGNAVSLVFHVQIPK